MRTHSQVKGQEGVALISALWLTIVVIGVVGTGTLLLQAHSAQTRVAFSENSQALQIARSGLVEGRSWLRRQTAQPVLVFEPILDNTASPPILDTIDPDIGIVREFQIAGRTWARYEVWKQWDTDPDPIRLALRQQYQCEDISEPRQSNAQGATWRLRSMGYVFNKSDNNVAYNVAPNYVIAKQLLEVECKRFVLQLPGTGALNVADGNNSHINTMGRILGGPTAAGIYFPAGTGSPTTGPKMDNRVTGTPALAGAATYDDSYEYVFGLSLDELKSLATMVINDHTLMPNPIPEGSIIICEENSMTFDGSNPLNGNGIVVLIGNVSILPNSNSTFSGFLYVDGQYTQRDPSEIRGGVVVTENMTLQGALDYATIIYDEGVLDALRAMFGSYNISSPVKRLRNNDQ